MTKYKLLFVLILLYTNSFSQSINLPTTDIKDSNDIHTIKRPALTFNGWYETSSSQGYSVKGYIQKLIANEISAVNDGVSLFNQDIDEIDQSVDNSIISNNAHVLEGLAFQSLISYIIEKNSLSAHVDTTSTKLAFSTHLSNLLSGMRQSNNSFPSGSLPRFYTNHNTDNTFKNSNTLMSMSRVYDYYISLKILMNYYNDTSHSLLSLDEEKIFNDALYNAMYQMWTDTTVKGIFGFLPFLQYDEVQAGNWPLIAKVALGYAALGVSTQQGILPSITGFGYYEDIWFLDDRIKEAIETAK